MTCDVLIESNCVRTDVLVEFNSGADVLIESNCVRTDVLVESNSGADVLVDFILSH